MTAISDRVTARASGRNRVGFVAVAAAGAHLALGLVLLGRSSLWGDEAFTAEAVRLPVGQLLSMLTRIDVNMSAYYLLLKAWVSVFGTSETALRLPSLIMSTATVGLAAWLMSRWFGPRPAAMTAVALGLNPFFIIIGVTARPFAMLALLSTAGLALFVAALGDRRPSIWVCVVFVDIMAFYSSLLAALSIAAQIVYLLLYDRRLNKALLPAVIIGFLAVVPAIMYVAPSDTLNWIEHPSAKALLETVWEASGRISGIVLVLLAVIGLALRPRPSGQSLAIHPHSRYLLPVFLLVPFALMLALLPIQSLFTPAYLINVFVAGAFMAGAAVANLSVSRAVVAAAVLAAGCIVGIVANLVPSPTLSNQNWKAVDARLDVDVKQGDAVVFPNTYYRVAGEYYARSGLFARVAAPRLPDVPWFSQPPDAYDKLKRTGYYLDRTRVLAGLSDVRTVWLVGPDDDWMQRESATLESAGWSANSTTSEPGLVLLHFER